MTLERRRLDVAGVVQGVGFRPFVHNAAVRLGLAGWVMNDAAGVAIEVEGPAPALAAFRIALTGAGSPAAGAAVAERALPAAGLAGFAIRPSALAAAASAVPPPDVATCPACVAEMLDPADRRHGYALITCAACGPRWTIVEGLPFDRARTAMRRFPPCAACRAEYADPADRRFHAETIACAACGPRVALADAAGRVLARDGDAIEAAVRALADGRIVAVKGLGGFQLLVDATDAAAVARLRARKHRPAKPFAVMVRDVDAARRMADVELSAAGLLASPAAPIVLLPTRAGAGLAPAVAPGLPLVGVMLPATGLHHLLLAGLGRPVVATSGNRSGEPIVHDEADAPARLGGIADLFLWHDRPIVRAVDDPVARIAAGRVLWLRRARGLAPLPLDLPAPVPPLLALGGHQKATVATAVGRRLFVGEHLGDLDGPAARDRHAAAAAALPALHGLAPVAVVHDRHPDYASTRLAATLGPRTLAVQHHLAHALAVLADNGRAPPALALVLDGTGHGEDGTVWGGELLRLGPGAAWARIGRLRPFPLPGGEAAVRAPWRAALGLLHAAGNSDLAGTVATPAERDAAARQMTAGLNAPWTSSAGRLFDAVAALLDLCRINGFEAEAAIRLEMAARAGNAVSPWPFALRRAGGRVELDDLTELDWVPMLTALAADRAAGVPVADMAARFHAGLAAGLVAMAAAAEGDGPGGGEPVALGGGCFQNAVLLEGVVAGLRAAGREPLWGRALPPNDEALAAGQIVHAAAVIAAEGGSRPCASPCPA